MAEGESVQSSFPLPPFQHINNYTDENVRLGRCPKPPPPPKDAYMMFGESLQADDAIIRPLETQGLKRLYPQNYDAKRELKKLNHSILANFLDLLSILIRAPASEKRREKMNDLTLLFIHVHHLINEFRPHQARETLRVMMTEQKCKRLETAERFQHHLNRVSSMLTTAIEQLPDPSSMETKLTIKQEGDSGGSSSSFSDVGGVFKSEPLTPSPEDDEDDDEEQRELNTQDQMMCDIVDAL